MLRIRSLACSAVMLGLLSGSAVAASSKAGARRAAATSREALAARLADIHAQLAVLEAEMAQLRSTLVEWQMLAEHTGSDRYGPPIAAARRELAALMAEYASLVRSAEALQEALSGARPSTRAQLRAK